jgi:hypothetical protein
MHMGYSSKSRLHPGLNYYIGREFKRTFEPQASEEKTVRFQRILRNVAPVAALSLIGSKALDY